MIMFACNTVSGVQSSQPLGVVASDIAIAFVDLFCHMTTPDTQTTPKPSEVVEPDPAVTQELHKAMMKECKAMRENFRKEVLKQQQEILAQVDTLKAQFKHEIEAKMAQVVKETITNSVKQESSVETHKPKAQSFKMPAKKARTERKDWHESLAELVEQKA